MGKVRRVVLADKPRVTRFPIQWGDKDEAAAMQMPSATSGDEEGRGAIPTEDDDEGMTLDEMAGEGEEEDAAEFEEEDEDDDVSLEGKDMMMGDLLMSNALSPEME